MQRVVISDEHLRQIYVFARSAFPLECCGYLRGVGAIADELVPCTNADREHPERNFAIDGDELFAFARTFFTHRPALVIYHSHTNGRAYFSTIDRRVAAGPAYPVQHVVIGVAPAASATGPAPPAVTDVAQFAWSDAEGDYVEIARWAPGAAP